MSYYVLYAQDSAIVSAVFSRYDVRTVGVFCVFVCIMLTMSSVLCAEFNLHYVQAFL